MRKLTDLSRRVAYIEHVVETIYFSLHVNVGQVLLSFHHLLPGCQCHLIHTKTQAPTAKLTLIFLIIISLIF